MHELLVSRHSFIRILGDANKKRVGVTCTASHIFIAMMEKTGVYDVFCVVYEFNKSF